MLQSNRLTGTVLFLLLILSQAAAAQFGPSETEEEAEERIRWEESIRQGYIDKRERLGETGFKAYAIATLDRLVDARPPGHPRFRPLSQQLGTAEHTLLTEPRFFHEVVPMLVEMEAEEAIPVLEEHVKVMEHLWRHRTNTYLGRGLDARRGQVQSAWFKLAVEHTLGLDEATEALAEMTTWPQALQRQVDYLLAQQKREGEGFDGWPYFELSIDEPESLFMKLAKWRRWVRGAFSGLRPIQQIARARAWSIDEDAVDRALEHEDMRIRVAAAMAFYVQEVRALGLHNLKAPEPLVIGTEAGDAYLLKTSEATWVRGRLIKVWEQLLEQRAELNADIPTHEAEEDFQDYRKRLAEYQETVEQGNALLVQLYHMVAFDEPDLPLIDLCIESAVYTGGFIHLVRHHENENLSLTDEQLERAARSIDNVFARPDRREQVIDGLIRLDYGPAAKTIAGYYQDLGLLDKKLNPVAKTGVGSKGVPAIRRLAPDKVAWLKKHLE